MEGVETALHWPPVLLSIQPFLILRVAHIVLRLARHRLIPSAWYATGLLITYDDMWFALTTSL